MIYLIKVKEKLGKLGYIIYLLIYFQHFTKTLGSGWAEEKEQKHEVKPQQEKTNKK